MAQTLLLELLGTSGCHLCDDAEAIIAAVVDSGTIQVDVVDIAYEESYFNLYSTRIPVVLHPQSGAELTWPFSHNDVRRFLHGILGSHE